MSALNIPGLSGKTEASVLKSIPSTGFSEYSGQTPLLYKSEPIAPKLMTSNIDVSSRRNVLPCKGITHQVLRPEPPPAAAGMVPPTGYGRHQPAGLSQEKPTDLKIMPFSNPFDSAKNNPLGAPK